MGIQRKSNYKVEFVFSDETLSSPIDSFTFPEINREVGSYKNQVVGHLNPEGNASFGTATFMVAFFVGESSNPTTTLINKLYAVDKTVDSVFDIRVAMIEQVDDAEQSTYIASLVGCKLSGIKYDDLGTDAEALMKATITVQPRTLPKLGGSEV